MKGVMHVIEAVIAIAMMAVAIAGLFGHAQPADNSAQLASAGYAALQHLEGTGQLRPALAARDTAAIRAMLNGLLGSFDLEICEPECTGMLQPGAAALDYFIAGNGSYEPVRLRLYVW